MTEIDTKFFGRMNCAEAAILKFPDGIPGFECERQLVAIRQPDTEPLVFLQSIASPGVCFTALPVQDACPDYELNMQADDIAALGLPQDRRPAIGKDVLCLTLLTIGEDGNVSANLLAPIVVNIATSVARQPVLVDSDYSHQHRLGQSGQSAL